MRTRRSQRRQQLQRRPAGPAGLVPARRRRQLQGREERDSRSEEQEQEHERGHEQQEQEHEQRPEPRRRDDDADADADADVDVAVKEDTSEAPPAKRTRAEAQRRACIVCYGRASLTGGWCGRECRYDICHDCLVDSSRLTGTGTGLDELEVHCVFCRAYTRISREQLVGIMASRQGYGRVIGKCAVPSAKAVLFKCPRTQTVGIARVTESVGTDRIPRVYATPRRDFSDREDVFGGGSSTADTHQAASALARAIVARRALARALDTPIMGDTASGEDESDSDDQDDTDDQGLGLGQAGLSTADDTSDSDYLGDADEGLQGRGLRPRLHPTRSVLARERGPDDEVEIVAENQGARASPEPAVPATARLEAAADSALGWLQVLLGAADRERRTLLLRQQAQRPLLDDGGAADGADDDEQEQEQEQENLPAPPQLWPALRQPAPLRTGAQYRARVAPAPPRGSSTAEIMQQLLAEAIQNQRE